jgi:threonine dehydrogenase-like Zn-dependent dehydrogenase
MKALLFDGKILSEVKCPIPKPAVNEVLIKTILAGICNTDLEIIKGYMKFRGIPGHEFVGKVVESPDPNFMGKQVVGEINLACGKCDFCLQGLGMHCPQRSVLGIQDKDGVFAEYLTLPIQNVHVVPAEIDKLKTVFVEPLAAACEIMEQIHILPDYRVLVIGDGKLAQLIARVLNLYTDNLLIVGKHPGKLELLNQKNIPAVHLNDFSQEKSKYHVVVEATGNWDGWRMAMEMVRPRGFIVLKSTYAGDQSFNPAPLVINEVTVIGSRCGPFKKAFYHLQKETVDPLDLITKVLPFSKWQDAFELAKKPDTLKVILEFK